MRDTGENSGPNYPDLPEQLNEEELELWRDMEWAVTDPEVQDKYPDEIVAVYRRQIISHGHDASKVLEEAQQVTGLPTDRIAVVTVIGPGIMFADRHYDAFFSE